MALAKKIIILILMIAIVCLGITVAYGYAVNQGDSSNYGYYGSTAPADNTEFYNDYGYGQSGNGRTYGTNYRSYGNFGTYGYGSVHGIGGMMGGYGRGMR